MDTKIELNTNEGISQFITKHIRGNLKALIISAKEPVDLTLVSELGYSVLTLQAFSGIDYYPLIVRAKDQIGHGANYVNVPFTFNEKLVITVSGGKNRQISIILRLEDESKEITSKN